jgi:hypothetical protein
MNTKKAYSGIILAITVGAKEKKKMRWMKVVQNATYTG